MRATAASRSLRRAPTLIVALTVGLLAFAWARTSFLPEVLLDKLHEVTPLPSSFSGARLVFSVSEERGKDLLSALRARLEGTGGVARRDGASVVVELADPVTVDARALAHQLTVDRTFEMRRVVDGSPRMAALAAQVRQDAHARELGITDALDAWETDRGFMRQDHYLTGPADALAAWWQDAASSTDLGDGVELRFEALAREPGHARSYLVEKAAILTGANVSTADVTWNPVTGRPEVLVVFDAEGARAFGEWTAAHVSDKLAILVDGAITSAPRVEGAITGGKSTVTMGGGADRQQVERDARALTEALRGGPLPAKLTLARIEDVRAGAGRGAWLWILAALLGVVAGGVGGLSLDALRRLPLAWFGFGPFARTAGAKSLPVGRLVVTLAAVPLVWLGGRILLPGVHLEAVMLGATRPGDLEALGFLALGIRPFLSAFVLVEVAALVVPAWRWRRHGGAAARRPLLAATAMLGITLAVVQAYFVATWMLSVGRGPGMSSPLVDPDGTGTLVLLVTSLVGGTLVLLVAAELLSRFGLVNGYSAILAASAAVALARGLGGIATGTLVTLVVIAGLAAGASLLRARLEPAGATLRLPASGYWPLAFVAIPATVIQLLGLFGLQRSVPDALARLIDHDPMGVVNVVVANAVTMLATWLFTRRVRAAAGPLVFSTALTASLVIMGTVAWLAWHASHVGLVDRPSAPIDVLGVITLVVVLLDAAAEWRARRQAGALVAVHELHDAHAVDGALAALAAAAIPAHARSAHHRAVLHFFAPYLPVVIAVPPAHAERARAILAA